MAEMPRQQRDHGCQILATVGGPGFANQINDLIASASPDVAPQSSAQPDSVGNTFVVVMSSPFASARHSTTQPDPKGVSAMPAHIEQLGARLTAAFQSRCVGGLVIDDKLAPQTAPTTTALARHRNDARC
jgi:hypothetical protein